MKLFNKIELNNIDNSVYSVQTIKPLFKFFCKEDVSEDTIDNLVKQYFKSNYKSRDFWKDVYQDVLKGKLKNVIKDDFDSSRKLIYVFKNIKNDNTSNQLTIEMDSVEEAKIASQELQKALEKSPTSAAFKVYNDGNVLKYDFDRFGVYFNEESKSYMVYTADSRLKTDYYVNNDGVKTKTKINDNNDSVHTRVFLQNFFKLYENKILVNTIKANNSSMFFSKNSFNEVDDEFISKKIEEIKTQNGIIKAENKQNANKLRESEEENASLTHKKDTSVVEAKIIEKMVQEKLTQNDVKETVVVQEAPTKEITPVQVVPVQQQVQDEVISSKDESIAEQVEDIEIAQSSIEPSSLYEDDNTVLRENERRRLELELYESKFTVKYTNLLANQFLMRMYQNDITLKRPMTYQESLERLIKNVSGNAFALSDVEKIVTKRISQIPHLINDNKELLEVTQEQAKEISNLTSEKKALEKQIVEKDKSITSLTNDVRKENAKVLSLTEQLNESKQEHLKKDNKIDNLSNDVFKLQKELKESKEQFEILFKKSEEMVIVVSSVKAENTDLKSTIEKQASAIEEFKTISETNVKEYNALADKFNKGLEVNKKLISELKSKDEVISSKDETITNKDGIIASKDEVIVKQSSELEKFSNQEDEISKLKASVKTSKIDINELKDENIKQKNEIKSKDETIAKQALELEELKKQFEMLKNSNTKTHSTNVEEKQEDEEDNDYRQR